MKKIIIFAALAVSGCMGRPIETTVPFNAQEVAYINQSGAADVEGQAFLRQQGGGVVTCAGETAFLIPAGQYATQRMTQIYGNLQGGKVAVSQGSSGENLDPNYEKMMRKATCDAEGDFTFNNVANGDYYVATAVTWTVGNAFVPEGGLLAQRISVRGGRSTRVLLSS